MKRCNIGTQEWVEKIERKVERLKMFQSVMMVGCLINFIAVVGLTLFDACPELRTILSLTIWIFPITQFMAGMYICGYWDGRLLENSLELKRIMDLVKEKEDGES